MTSSREAEKQLAAEHAVTYARNGMLIGLGTGSTAKYAILALGQKVREGLKITGVPSSKATEHLARSAGIPLADFSRSSHLDLTIDGADEIDRDLRAIKGGGGALLREKILASASDLMIAIVDSSKLVERLGTQKVPVEVLPFAAEFVRRSLAPLNAEVVLRSDQSGSPFKTDQNNFILDLSLPHAYEPDRLAVFLEVVPGVVEHGLFLTEIDLLIAGVGDKVAVTTRG